MASFHALRKKHHYDIEPAESVEQAYAQPVLSAMLDAVIVVGLDGLISMVNDATYRLLGYNRAGIIGHPVAVIFADQESVMRTTRMQAPTPGLELRKEEVAFLAKNGDHIPVSVTASAMLDSDQHLSGIVLVARDLRETRRLLAEVRRAKEHVEAQLDEARKQLLHAERLATLGTLAGGVGHELKNILTVLRFCSDEIGDLVAEGTVPEQLHKDLTTVDAHIMAHAKRLLNLARPGPDYVEPIELANVVRQTLDMLCSAGKTKHVAIAVDVPKTSLVVRVNRTRIEQILVNLVRNAADAIEEAERAEPRIAITLCHAGERAICRVKDNGCGIPAAKLERIFESFYTTKPSEKGTGLGLSVVKQIVESYGGAVTVETTHGQGTTVTFDLPVDQLSR